MKWNVVAASVRGTSHHIHNQPCQDDCLTRYLPDTPQGPVLLLLVADGAGSAHYGGEGATLCIHTAATELTHYLVQQEKLPDAQWLTACVDRIRQALQQQAEHMQTSLRNFACTFLVAIISAQGSRLCQIGDGGIVINHQQQWMLPIIPMSGEYANMTHFITDDDALENVAIYSTPDPVQQIALFTDGIQRLALNMQDYSVHKPFFLPLFQVMKEIRPDQEAQLEGAMIDFLNSDKVNARTDDDKTLVLAVLNSPPISTKDLG